MTEEKKGSPASDETKKTDKKEEELTIPKTRFDEVNQKAKELEAKLAEIEKEKKEAEKKKLEEEGKIKELLEMTKSENDKLKIEGLKRDLIQEAIISKKLHPKLSKMVTGSTEEEIKKSLEEAIAFNSEIQDQIKDDKTATDNTGSGKKGKFTPMSTEEWMRLYEKDPKEADRILKEETEAAKK